MLFNAQPHATTIYVMKDLWKVSAIAEILRGIWLFIRARKSVYS